jgi:hypothetical protein
MITPNTPQVKFKMADCEGVEKIAKILSEENDTEGNENSQKNHAKRPICSRCK